MSKNENQGFVCQHCGKNVVPLTNGSYRNHCPFCLYSLHVDIMPGDRANDCKGLMQPIKVEYNSKKGFQIIHSCTKCGAIQKNKIAEDTEQEDNKEIIYKLMAG